MVLKIKSRLWIESKGNILLGEGRMQLLMAIEEYGSINRASKNLGMSYKKAWRLVKELNEIGSEKIVIQKTGGNGGGGSSISPYGKKVMKTFDNMKRNIWQFMDDQENLINKVLK